MTSLWLVTQGINESLESYTERFTATYSCITNLNEELAIQPIYRGSLMRTFSYPFVAMTRGAWKV